MKPNIAEIKKMIAAATPGPWKWTRKNFEETNSEGGYDVYDLMHWESESLPRNGIAILTAFNDKRGIPIVSAFSPQDARIIEEAPKTISDLCDFAEKQTKEIDAMQKVIKEADEEIERRDAEIDRLRKALIRERDEAMAWDGIGTVNRINEVLESGEALRRDTQQ